MITAWQACAPPVFSSTATRPLPVSGKTAVEGPGHGCVPGFLLSGPRLPIPLPQGRRKGAATLVAAAPAPHNASENAKKTAIRCLTTNGFGGLSLKSAHDRGAADTPHSRRRSATGRGSAPSGGIHPAGTRAPREKRINSRPQVVTRPLAGTLQPLAIWLQARALTAPSRSSSAAARVYSACTSSSAAVAASCCVFNSRIDTCRLSARWRAAFAKVG